MGKFLIFTYILIALFASGFAKASVFGVESNIHEVAYDKGNMSFDILGQSPTACNNQVVTAEQLGPKGTEILIKVLDTVSTSAETYCNFQVTPFIKKVSLFELIQISKIKIDPSLTYTIGVSNSPETVELSGLQLLGH
ncbi:MAG TPA: hypothetical protein DCL41_06425 [Bdellovibrionales bacterium]|nr:hypothetical protein [Pseudobdellovibrionaceae bacterium]HAG91486.1 hypothetical protein [Bdellovibrionales bacterium]